MATSDAPVSIGSVALTVRDLDAVGDFYEKALGMARLARDGETMRLGAAGRTLLELRRDPNAQYRPREAGLFHTAFLLPERADLGRWIKHAAESGMRLDGVSDHLVSEALYLHDPEGNGIEIYIDRPRDQWTRNGAQVKMATLPLDLDAIVASAPGQWAGIPAGSVVGHVHLQVGDTQKADDFYVGVLGLDMTTRYPGASFYATGGYHHHLAGNIWNSRGAGVRSPDSTGLAEVTLLAAPDEARRLGAASFVDPWGTRIAIAPKAG